MVRVTAMSFSVPARFRRDRAGARQGVEDGLGRLSPVQYRADRRRERQAGKVAHHLGGRGFPADEIEVTQEESQLWIRGRQQDDKTREYIHRGIAARQFQRSFLLAEGMQVLGAELAKWLVVDRRR